MFRIRKRPDDGAPTPGTAPADQLRLQAEASALATAAISHQDEETLSPEATRRVLHELRVHQIELEMQNEELREAQVELEAARMRYFDLYDLAPVGYCSVSEQGLILQANLAAATLLGLSRAALTMQPISSVIFRADQDVYYLCRQQLIATGEGQVCELRMVKSDGKSFWVQLAITAAQEVGGAATIRVVLNDINDRKLMESAMRESEERYRAMVEWSPEAIAVHRAGRMVYVNPAAVRMLGAKSARQLAGRPILDIIHPIFHAAAQRLPDLSGAGLVAPMAEMQFLRLDGTLIDVEAQGTAIVYEGAPATHFAWRDITERRRVSDALHASEALMRQAMEEAREANRAKSDFLSSMSHELRTPLGTMLGFAQLLESGTPAPTPSQKRSIDQILRAGWYLLELINEVLDLALIESGKLSLSLEPMALAEVMLECRAMVEPQAQKRAIVLRSPPPGMPYFVNADRIRLKQVLINLLSNAIKYNREGGTVDLQCVVTTPERIRICVTDTGQGLAQEQTAQLFQPFNRLGQEANGEEGTGIGLVTCKRLIELMGGAIGVESTVGEGSVFWIEMNLAPQPQSAVSASEVTLAATRTHVASGGPSRTLLYVEDNAANLMLMEELIARRPDMRLLTARDAHAGIMVARASRPDALLMDLNLSGTGGIDALQILALDPVTAHIPVIALSASAMPQDIEKGLAAGFRRYLTKPIKVDVFMDTLDETLEFAQATSDRAAIEGGLE